MREILVVFEIENELQRQEFINKIKSLGAWARVLSNAYIVRSSNKTAVTKLKLLREQCNEIVTRNKRILFVLVEVNKWLKY